MHSVEQIHKVVVRAIEERGKTATLDRQLALLRQMRAHVKKHKRFTIKRIVYIHRLDTLINAIVLQPSYARKVIFKEGENDV